MKCPHCGLFNPDTAQRCDCGYDFETKVVEKPYVEWTPRRFKWLNWFFPEIVNQESARKAALWGLYRMFTSDHLR